MPNDRRAYAQNMFSQHPELFPEDRRQSILDSVVIAGMTPFEAQMAAGPFSCRVVPDPLHWPPDSDPIEVMWAQSHLPDNSEIWMNFKNTTQFPDRGEVDFRVYFTRGQATRIVHLAH